MDSTPRRFQKARIHVDCKHYVGEVVAFVIKNPVIDLIIGNMKHMKAGKEMMRNTNSSKSVTTKTDTRKRQTRRDENIYGNQKTGDNQWQKNHKNTNVQHQEYHRNRTRTKAWQETTKSNVEKEELSRKNRNYTADEKQIKAHWNATVITKRLKPSYVNSTGQEELLTQHRRINARGPPMTRGDFTERVPPMIQRYITTRGPLVTRRYNCKRTTNDTEKHYGKRTINNTERYHCTRTINDTERQYCKRIPTEKDRFYCKRKNTKDTTDLCWKPPFGEERQYDMNRQTGSKQVAHGRTYNQWHCRGNMALDQCMFE